MSYPKKGKGKGSPNSLAERRVPRLIPVLGSQPASDVSHKSDGRLQLLSARPAVTPAGCYQFCCFVNRGTMGVNSLPKTVSRQSRDCDLNLGPSAPEFSTLTTRLPSHPVSYPHNLSNPNRDHKSRALPFAAGCTGQNILNIHIINKQIRLEFCNQSHFKVLPQDHILLRVINK